MSWSRGLKKIWFGSDLSIFGGQLQFEFMDDYEMTQIAFKSMEEVSYCLSRSSVKYQGHMGWQIDLDFIWDYKAGRRDLSDPSDLPLHVMDCLNVSFWSFAYKLCTDTIAHNKMHDSDWLVQKDLTPLLTHWSYVFLH